MSFVVFVKRVLVHLRSANARLLAGCLIVAPLITVNSAHAGAWRWQFEAGVEDRYFIYKANDPVQLSQHQLSLFVMPELQWEDASGKQLVVLQPFYRQDAEDDERSHGDIREGYYQYISESDWQLTVGFSKVFWGKTESRHLVDIINQTDAIEEIDEEDKLGQPMIQLNWFKEWGTVDLFILTGFRERVFPGIEGRLRGPVIDQENPLFENDDEEQAIDAAISYSHYNDRWDYGVRLFYGTSREPRFLIGNSGQLQPYYDEIFQFGTDIQYTVDAWLWKLEGMFRHGQHKDFAASVFGFEYTLYQIADTTYDLGLLLEHQYDSRPISGTTVEDGRLLTSAPVTVSDNDLFLGARLAFNNSQDTSLLAGVAVDLEHQARFIGFEGEHRLNDHWVVVLNARWFQKADPETPDITFADDDHLTLQLKTYW